MKTILIDAADTFTTEQEGKYAIFEDLANLLDNYQNPKIIVTNANEEQQKLFGLEDLPYPLFTLSHEPNKDDPVYFQKLLQEHKLTSNEVLYFEHSKEAVTSAQSVGIESYFYDHEAKNLEALKVFLDSNL